MTTNRLIVYNCVCGVVSHVIGVIPLTMSEVMETQHCSEYDLLLGVEYNISYALIVLLLFIAIGMSYRSSLLTIWSRQLFYTIAIKGIEDYQTKSLFQLVGSVGLLAKACPGTHD